MRRMLLLLLLFPLGVFCQCPQWINQPLRNTVSFMSLMEQRLSFKFSDSSITPGRDKMVFNDKDGKYIVRVTLKGDNVSSIHFEAPVAAINEFSKWFTDVFGGCAEKQNEEDLLFPDCTVITRKMGTTKEVFYMDSR